jgi:hypothetical protein
LAGIEPAIFWLAALLLEGSSEITEGSAVTLNMCLKQELYQPISNNFGVNNIEAKA